MRDIRFLCTHSLRLMCIEWLGGYVRFPLCYRWIFHRIEISSRLDVLSANYFWFFVFEEEIKSNDSFDHEEKLDLRFNERKKWLLQFYENWWQMHIKMVQKIQRQNLFGEMKSHYNLKPYSCVKYKWIKE